METRTRSIAKAASYRVLGSVVTSLIVLALTGKSELSLSVGALDMILKVSAYFVHERIWDRIDFGRRTTKTNASNKRKTWQETSANR